MSAANAAGCKEAASRRLPLARRWPTMSLAHYEDMLALYGVESGLRQARKHLGWYLDRHGTGLGALRSDDHDRRSTLPQVIRGAARRIPCCRREDRACRSGGMSVSAYPVVAEADAAQIVLNTIRRPVIMIGPEGTHRLCQCRRGGFFRSSAADAAPQDAGAFRAVRQPDPGAGRSGARAKAAPVNEYRVDVSSPRLGIEKVVDLYVAPVPELSGLRGRDVPGTLDGRQDRPPDDASQRGPLGHRPCGDAGA